MIINKTTSDSALTSTLYLFDAIGKPITGVSEFNTSTFEATLSVGGASTAADFKFYVADATEAESVVSTLQAIVGVEPQEGEIYPPFHVEVKPAGKTKKAMDDADTAPVEVLKVHCSVGTVLVQCSNCSTYFIVFTGPRGALWTGEQTNPTDKWLTATQLDPGNITCDNCGEGVVYSTD